MKMFKVIGDMTYGKITGDSYGCTPGEYSQDAYKLWVDLGYDQEEDDLDSWQDIIVNGGDLYAVWGDNSGVTMYVMVQQPEERKQVFKRSYISEELGMAVIEKIYDNGNGTFDAVALIDGELAAEWENQKTYEDAEVCINEFDPEQ